MRVGLCQTLWLAVDCLLLYVVFLPHVASIGSNDDINDTFHPFTHCVLRPTEKLYPINRYSTTGSVGILEDDIKGWTVHPLLVTDTSQFIKLKNWVQIFGTFADSELDGENNTIVIGGRKLTKRTNLSKKWILFSTLAQLIYFCEKV